MTLNNGVILHNRCALAVCGQIKKPEYLLKMKEGRKEEINLDVTGRIQELGWPYGLIHMYETTDTPGLPPVKGVSKAEYYVDYS